MVRVKICGITNLDDALHAVSCGADALGFVFFPESPRYVEPDRARQIIAELPPLLTCVGLFVNELPSSIIRTVEYCGLNTIQLHGDEGPEQCNFPPYRVIKALRISGQDKVEALSDYQVSALLLDACVPGQFGGTGQLSDWDLAAQIAESRPLILAGGLNPENVAAAVRAVRPYAVDVSSGVETEPGRKNPRKVAQFIQRAKEPV
ncbi:MAG: phosphoribosylanthranilate isomerase [Desulfuromonadales bacterium]|jgi:phosphoribosylanthranilate isomerase|nr:phosphoribosylanthranilate isomerase [Desulfuromonadales bacterium]